MITFVETAIVLLIPDAEPLAVRARAAVGALGPSMPAHITLLYPFALEPDAGVIEELRFFFAGVDGFPLTFSATGSFPEVVYLAPDQDAECRELIRALARRWPEYPPYGGLFGLDDAIPHLTVVNTPDGGVREAIVPELEKHLPLQTVVSEASLWMRETDGWHCRATFPLSDPEP